MQYLLTEEEYNKLGDSRKVLDVEVERRVTEIRERLSVKLAAAVNEHDIDLTRNASFFLALRDAVREAFEKPVVTPPTA